MEVTDSGSGLLLSSVAAIGESTFDDDDETVLLRLNLLAEHVNSGSSESSCETMSLTSSSYPDSE